MSFLNFFPRKKVTDFTKELQGPYVPLDTIDLDYSIAAVSNNLVLNCKSCKPNEVNSNGIEDNEDRLHHYSGYIGVISKRSFLIYEVAVKLHQEFSYKLIQTVLPAVLSPLNQPYITGAKWIRLRKGGNKLTVLVVTSSVSVTIYSENGINSICTLEYVEKIPDVVCKSIASTQSQIFVGNGRGEVHTFKFLEGKVEFQSTTVIQVESISQMCCRRSIFVTGSPTGVVRVWKIKEQKAVRRCCFKTQLEECVTGMGIWESFIIATYGSGVFRIFHWATKRLMARVFAHSRWIVSMDVLAHRGLLLTVAEDDAVLIWKLTCSKQTEKSLKGLGSIKSIKKKIMNMQRPSKLKNKKTKISVELGSSIQTDNMLLVGGKFLNCMGSAVALANYGVKEIYFYGKTGQSDGPFNA